jgi:hypothetical protein
LLFHYYSPQIELRRRSPGERYRESEISAPHVERDGECGAHGGREGAAAGRRAGGRQSGAFRCEESHYFVHCAGKLGLVFLLGSGRVGRESFVGLVYQYTEPREWSADVCVVLQTWSYGTEEMLS